MLTPEEIEAIVLDELAKSEDPDARAIGERRQAEEADDSALLREVRERRGY
jgi:hypothetical protein